MLGTYEGFDKGANMLKEALAYFYTNAMDISLNGQPMYFTLLKY